MTCESGECPETAMLGQDDMGTAGLELGGNVGALKGTEETAGRELPMRDLGLGGWPNWYVPVSPFRRLS